MTDRYAVIGNPVAHSQSPHIHRMFAQALGEDIEYGLVLGHPGRFVDDVREFRQSGGRGLNVTVPFKLNAYSYATRRSERATHAGAVNTLKFDGDDVLGDNTDGAGLVRDVRDGFGFAIEGARVLLMGAGGAARGALLSLLAERPARIAIVNRTVARAEALAASFASHAAGVALRGGGSDDVAGEAFDLVINATSASLVDALPPLPADVFAHGALAYDMVYGPRARPFISYALAQGAGRAVDGLGMLVEQAAESFFLWRGVRPATGPVLAALRARDAEAPR
jgi:shikimate dehydrogenase